MNKPPNLQGIQGDRYVEYLSERSFNTCCIIQNTSSSLTSGIPLGDSRPKYTWTRSYSPTQECQALLETSRCPLLDLCARLRLPPRPRQKRVSAIHFQYATHIFIGSSCCHHFNVADGGVVINSEGSIRL